MADKIEIHYASKSIACTAGVSVAAALTEAGERIFRTTRKGAGRGVFCGMGVCQDCLVTIDAVPNQRACMTIERDGMEVEPQSPAPVATAANEKPLRQVELTPDVLVIGGGPGGLAAAAVTAETGLDVVLADERQKLGGQYYKQPIDAFVREPEKLDRQFRKGRALIERSERAGVRMLTGTSVWAVSGPEEIMAAGPDAAYTIRPKRLIVATGAYERGVPMPGWTLPGFMTTGAAQTFLRSYQVAPGRRILLSGNGPLNLQVAVELLRKGCTVVALAELSAAPGPGKARELLQLAANAPDLALDGVRYLATMRRASVPIFHRHAVIRADGKSQVERATIAEIDMAGNPVAGTEKNFDVDTVCAGFGFLPSNEIARTIGCKHRFDEHRGHLVVERDDCGRSSMAEVWVVGDCGGLGGARTAQAMGIAAGADCARDLGKPARERTTGEMARAARTLKRNAQFQDALWRIYRAPRIIDQFAALDTLICRCEEVPLAAVDDAVGRDIAHVGGIKRMTRAGMGRCQGRYCASLMMEIAARRSGQPIDEFSLFAPRIPFKPIPIAHIAPASDAP